MGDTTNKERQHVAQTFWFSTQHLGVAEFGVEYYTFVEFCGYYSTFVPEATILSFPVGHARSGDHPSTPNPRHSSPAAAERQNIAQPAAAGGVRILCLRVCGADAQNACDASQRIHIAFDCGPEVIKVPAHVRIAVPMMLVADT